MFYAFQNLPALKKERRLKDYKNLFLRIILAFVFSCATFYLLLYSVFLSRGLNLGVPTKETVITRFSRNIAATVLFEQQKNVPVRLEIPALNVKAVIASSGLDNRGVMEISEDPNVATWFNLGAFPGEIGNAVISGHYGWKDNTAAVFDSLYKTHVGDLIEIEDSAGGITTFVVRKTERYAPGSSAQEVFRSNDGKSHLNLITCEGDWNSDSKSYSERLVVFADKK